MLSSGHLDLTSGTRDFRFLREGGIRKGLESGLWDLRLQASDFRLRDLYILTPDHPPLRPLCYSEHLHTAHLHQVSEKRQNVYLIPPAEKTKATRNFFGGEGVRGEPPDDDDSDDDENDDYDIHDAQKTKKNAAKTYK